MRRSGVQFQVLGDDQSAFEALSAYGHCFYRRRSVFALPAAAKGKFEFASGPPPKKEVRTRVASQLCPADEAL